MNIFGKSVPHTDVMLSPYLVKFGTCDFVTYLTTFLNFGLHNH